MNTVLDLVTNLYPKNWVKRILRKLEKFSLLGTEPLTTELVLFLGNTLEKVSHVIRTIKQRHACSSFTDVINLFRGAITGKQGDLGTTNSSCAGEVQTKLLGARPSESNDSLSESEQCSLHGAIQRVPGASEKIQRTLASVLSRVGNTDSENERIIREQQETIRRLVGNSERIIREQQETIRGSIEESERIIREQHETNRRIIEESERIIEESERMYGEQQETIRGMYEGSERIIREQQETIRGMYENSEKHHKLSTDACSSTDRLLSSVRKRKPIATSNADFSNRRRQSLDFAGDVFVDDEGLTTVKVTAESVE